MACKGWNGTAAVCAGGRAALSASVAREQQRGAALKAKCSDYTRSPAARLPPPPLERRFFTTRMSAFGEEIQMRLRTITGIVSTSHPPVTLEIERNPPLAKLQCGVGLFLSPWAKSLISSPQLSVAEAFLKVHIMFFFIPSSFLFFWCKSVTTST